MTVKELIKALYNCNPDKVVRFHVDWGNEPEIDSWVQNSDTVLLGNDLPPERYERDYKYERG